MLIPSPSLGLLAIEMPVMITARMTRVAAVLMLFILLSPDVKKVHYLSTRRRHRVSPLKRYEIYRKKSSLFRGSNTNSA
jgi:hypothetical protein